MRNLTYAFLTTVALVSATACGGDDGDGSDDSQRACTVDDSCFETVGGNQNAHIGLCNSLGGTLSDGCETGPLVGCCAHDAVNQCFYEMEGDPEALANICASQMGIWTNG